MNKLEELEELNSELIFKIELLELKCQSLKTQADMWFFGFIIMFFVPLYMAFGV